MRLAETMRLLRVSRPPAPYGAWNLARCYSIEDVARKARRRLPLGARAYLETGGEDEYTLSRNRAAFDAIEFLPRQPGDVTDADTAATVLGRRLPLPLVLSPVGAPRMFHLADSGFRRGSDIAAALALGAKAVLVGRAHLYGLAAAGEAGVRHCIDILAQELRMTMQLCGARTLGELDRSLLRCRSQLS